MILIAYYLIIMWKFHYLSQGWIMQYGSEPNPEACRSDDENKLLLPVEDKEQNGKAGETGENGDMGPKVADWRFGPAQLWYDMLEVPETGDGFNYGFKIEVYD